MLNEQLQQQIEEMKVKMTHNDRRLQKKMQQMTTSHHEDVKRLTNALEDTSKKLSSSGRPLSPEMKHQQSQMEELIRVEAPVMPFRAPKSPRRPTSPKHLSMMPSDEDDESTTFGTATHTGSLHMTGKEATQSTLGSTLGEMPLGTAEFLDQLHGNNALTLLRQQYATDLQERIIRQGIPQDRLVVSRQVLDHKLQMLQTQRQTYMKKYVDFMALRHHFDELSTRRAKEQLRMQKRSPRPGNPNPLSASTPPVVPSPHHGHHSQRFGHQSASAGNLSYPSTTAGNPAIRVSSPGGPRPAPRSASPAKTLHSTGSTTEWTSTNWDSDDSEENDYKQPRGSGPVVTVARLSPSSAATSPRPGSRPRTPTPSPRPRTRGQPTLIKAKPLKDYSDDDDDDDFDDSESTVSPRKGQPQPSNHKVIMSVPKLTRSIELQLSRRNENKKPVGGVDTVKTAKTTKLPKKPTSDVLEDFDDSDFLLSSDEEKSPPKRPGTRQSHGETDYSTNTYGTSAWGSSSKVASSVDRSGEKKLAGRNSFTDVSEDDDLNLENI
ncbi:uncharacterized protein LOC121371742 isoform X2 [Gigantopelta aegis]|uniref:uncharacterized protein LOC121371742 isoform X2 n=1 Tax=Gigantopelta aegis TaxID=1735272 RepID=UPI001B88C28B|nr:uncharacterized protein LOC121371742 isoform X2 [Gigantopelta aegis]